MMTVPEEAVERARKRWHEAHCGVGFECVPSDHCAGEADRETMRAALEAAALPYLAPAGRCTCTPYMEPHPEMPYDEPSLEPDPDCPVHFPAPAGDGGLSDTGARTASPGLREALEAAARDKIAEWYGSEWNASEDKFYETYDGGGISCVDDEAMLELRGVRLALDLALSAHPAAPAVPQPASEATPELTSRPVDREALEALVAEWRQSADEDERYLNRAHASEIHDVYASIRINREHADAVLAVLAGEQEQVEP